MPSYPGILIRSSVIKFVNPGSGKSKKAKHMGMNTLLKKNDTQITKISRNGFYLKINNITDWHFEPDLKM